MMLMDLNKIGFLKDGKYRLKILKEISIAPQLPSELADKLNLKRESVSRILRDLKEKNMMDLNGGSIRYR